MRQIRLSVAEIGMIGDQKVKPMPFSTAIINIVEVKPGGMSLAEVRQAVRVMEAAEVGWKSGRGFMLLEDADWIYLKERIKQHSFPYANAALVQLADAIEEAREISPADIAELIG